MGEGEEETLGKSTSSNEESFTARALTRVYSDNVLQHWQ